MGGGGRGAGAGAAAPGPGLRPMAPDEARAVDKALARVLGAGPPARAPVLLRLPFHDAGTYREGGDPRRGGGGLNASVRLELDRPENKGLKRGWRTVEEAHAALAGSAAEGAVSLADCEALVGARAVRLCGGPDISVRVGRADAAVPDPEGRLPSEVAAIGELKSAFAGMGFSAREFVALCGAHTIGSKGFGGPLEFDNAYYRTLPQRPWAAPGASEMDKMTGLPSDHVLVDDPECLSAVKAFAADQGRFFDEFRAAYIKLTEIGWSGSPA